jgi:hypothetical protein
VSCDPDYLIRIRVVRDPVPGDRPVSIRLRWFLKAALRAYGLKAVSIEEVPAREPAGHVGEAAAIPEEVGP